MILAIKDGQFHKINSPVKVVEIIRKRYLQVQISIMRAYLDILGARITDLSEAM